MMLALCDEKSLMSDKEFTVYWIKLIDHHDLYSQGYIGVTDNIERRWKRHKKQVKVTDKKVNKRPLYRAFRALGLEKFELNVIASGLDRWSAYNIEFCLRPHENIGYNCAAGGNFSSPLLCSSLSPICSEEKSIKKIRSAIRDAVEYHQTRNNTHNNAMHLTIKSVLPFHSSTL